MENHPFRRSFLTQHLHDVAVGVPVVDLQRQVQAFGDVDVPPEGVPLVRQALAESSCGSSTTTWP